MTISETLLPQWDYETSQLRKTLVRVPVDKFNYKPHPKSWTMLELATHLTQLPVWAKMTVETNELDLSIPFERDPLAQTSEELIATLDKNLAAAHDAIASATDEQMRSMWTLKMGDHVIMSMPKIAVIRGMVLSHFIHHRGELCVYFRLNDIPVPALYGPSADES